MRLAMPIWNQHLSPVFDCAEHLLMVDVCRARERKRELVLVTETQPVRRAEQLVSLGVEVLICGALTRPLEDLLTGSGICVLARRCGEVDAVLQAFLRGRLGDHQFCLPGCCRGHRRQRKAHVKRRQTTPKP